MHTEVGRGRGSPERAEKEYCSSSKARSCSIVSVEPGDDIARRPARSLVAEAAVGSSNANDLGAVAQSTGTKEVSASALWQLRVVRGRAAAMRCARLLSSVCAEGENRSCATAH